MASIPRYRLARLPSPTQNRSVLGSRKSRVAHPDASIPWDDSGVVWVAPRTNIITSGCSALLCVACLLCLQILFRGKDSTYSQQTTHPLRVMRVRVRGSGMATRLQFIPTRATEGPISGLKLPKTFHLHVSCHGKWIGRTARVVATIQGHFDLFWPIVDRYGPF